MFKAKLTLNSGQALAEVRAKSWNGVRRAVAFLHSKYLEAVGISNPRPYLTPSRPGEPPRKRTGFLQRNILYELDQGKGVGKIGVGANAKYGAFLELGAPKRNLLPRPFLVATLKKFWATIKALAETG